MTDEEADTFAGFERDGEERVKENLAANRYGERKAPLASLWLERNAQARADASAAAQSELLQRSTEAAERSALEAQRANCHASRANTIALCAAVVAGLALIVAIIALATNAT